MSCCGPTPKLRWEENGLLICVEMQAPSVAYLAFPANEPLLAHDVIIYHLTLPWRIPDAKYMDGVFLVRRNRTPRYPQHPARDPAPSTTGVMRRGCSWKIYRIYNEETRLSAEICNSSTPR